MHINLLEMSKPISGENKKVTNLLPADFVQRVIKVNVITNGVKIRVVTVYSSCLESRTQTRGWRRLAVQNACSYVQTHAHKHVHSLGYSDSQQRL